MSWRDKSLQDHFLKSEEKEMKVQNKKHLKGVGSKEQRQYEHILDSEKKEGRYGKRAKEIAARTVMKHHSDEGHKKGN